MRRLLLCRILLCRSKSSNHMIQRKAMNLVRISKHVHIFIIATCTCNNKKLTDFESIVLSMSMAGLPTTSSLEQPLMSANARLTNCKEVHVNSHKIKQHKPSLEFLSILQSLRLTMMQLSGPVIWIASLLCSTASNSTFPNLEEKERSVNAQYILLYLHVQCT